MGGQAARQGNALAFAAAKFKNRALFVALQRDQRQHFGHTFPNGGVGESLHFQPKGHIFGHIFVRKERKFLKHQAKLALIDRDAVEIVAVKAQRAGIGDL